MNPTLGGNVCVRNALSLDYCFVEAIKSLLEICDEVVCCDSDSSDGTRELLDEWKTREPRINICNFRWEDPKGDIWYWPRWLNYARQHLKTEWHIQLDADEVLHENSYNMVRKAVEARQSVICRRYNFWQDAQHLIPPGVCCGTDVIRIGPQNQWLPSDYPDPRAEQIQREAVFTEPRINIMHYGFIRETKAFFRKARAVQKIWANSYDPRLEKAEKYEAGHWGSMPGVTDWEDKLVPFTGTHPKLIHNWLTERHHSIYAPTEPN